MQPGGYVQVTTRLLVCGIIRREELFGEYTGINAKLIGQSSLTRIMTTAKLQIKEAREKACFLIFGGNIMTVYEAILDQISCNPDISEKEIDELYALEPSESSIRRLLDVVQGRLESCRTPIRILDNFTYQAVGEWPTFAEFVKAIPNSELLGGTIHDIDYSTGDYKGTTWHVSHIDVGKTHLFSSD